MARVLLIGSDRRRVAGIRAILREDGHNVTPLWWFDRWRETEGEHRPELVIAAVGSTDSVLGVSSRPARGFPAPLLFVQNDADPFRQIHVDERLVDRIESPFMSEEFLARVDALVRVRRVVMRTKLDTRERPAPAGVQDRSLRQQLESSGRALKGIGGRLAGILGARIPRYEKPLAPYLEVAARTANWADQRDVFEPGHAERVASFAAMIAEGLGLPDGEASALLRAAMLHDIGKIALPVEVLRRRSPLREQHKRLIRMHPAKGAALLRALDRDDEVTEAILYHHEQPDGAGYYGKKPDAIPRTAAILGVAEAYDAMTSSKLTPPLSSEQALVKLRDQGGWKYDTECVGALVDAIRPRTTAIPLSKPST